MEIKESISKTSPLLECGCIVRQNNRFIKILYIDVLKIGFAALTVDAFDRN